MDIVFESKENVENRPDPTTEFEGIGYDIIVAPGSGIGDVTFSGNDTESRDSEIYTDEGTNVRMDVSLTHDGLIDEKPSIRSNNFYLLKVNVTLLELGADPRDIHDLEVETRLEDSSLGSLIPGSGAVRYFSAYGINATEIQEGESQVFNFAMTPSTNLNATEVDLKVTIKFAEDLELGFDPNSEYNINFETKLNNDLSNEGFDDSDETEASFSPIIPMILVLVSIPIIRRKLQ